MNSTIEKLDMIKTIIRYTLNSAAVLIVGVIQSYFLIIPNQKELSALFLAMLLLILSEIVFRLLQFIIDNSRIIRRLILTNQYFEGVWLDRVEFGNNFIQYGIIEISYNKGVYHVLGQSYSPEGKPLGNWESSASWASNKKLRYIHKSNFESPLIQDFDGITEIFFLCAGSTYPNTYNGTYIDICPNPHKNRFIGERINKLDFKKLKTVDGRTNFIKDKHLLMSSIIKKVDGV
jgi:hypothetical protein